MRNLYKLFFRVSCVVLILLQAFPSAARRVDHKPAAYLHHHIIIATHAGVVSAGTIDLDLPAFAVTANAGLDTTLPFAQMDSVTRLPLNGSGSGSITSWQWTQLSGAAVTIVAPNAQHTIATGFQPGNYSFQLTVSDGSTTATSVINVRCVNYQTKGASPCRAGAPVVWTLAPTVNSSIFYPYLRGSGFDIQGGDTIKIPGGTYTGISLGDFGGSAGCPVVVVPADVVTVTSSAGYFRIGSGNGDSNFVAHAIIDGDYLQSKGVKYGFRFINTAPSPSTIGLTLNLATDIEAMGFYLENVGVGVMAKLDSDSSRPWRLFNYFYLKNLHFHDFFIHRTTGEAMYLGHTSPNGDPTFQAGNDGPTVRIDSIEVNNVMVDSSGWDGIQVSNAIYANIHDNIVLRSGSSNVGDQRSWIIMGGNTTGNIFNNFGYNMKEGIRGTPYGVVNMYNNWGDSLKIGGTSDDAVYMTGIATGPGTVVAETRAKFQPNAYGNVFGNFERFGINFPSAGYNSPGKISNNYIINMPGPTANQYIGTADDAVTGNLLVANFPMSARNVGSATTGFRVQVTQGDSTRIFTTSDSIITWLKCRLTGTCAVGKKKVTVNAGTDQTITLPVNTVALTGVADGNGTLTYAWTKLTGPSSYSVTAPAAATTTVTNLVQGTYSFVLTVTDTTGQSASDTVNVKVNPAAVAAAPVANAGSDQVITLPVSSAILSGAASTDAGGTIVTYAWKQLSGPSNAAISGSGTVTATAGGLVTGQYVFQLTVTNNSSLSATAQVTVTVNPVATVAPVANAGANQSITLPTNSATLNGSASSDQSGTIVSYSWKQTGGPSVATFNGTGAIITVSGLVAGQYVFQLTVTNNGGASATAEVAVTVNPAVVVNPPVADAGPDQVITLPVNSVALSGAASTDVGGTIVTYAWQQLSGPSTSSISGSGTVTATASGLVAGQYVFQLTVTNNGGLSATAQLTVTVNPVATVAPTANAGSNQFITLPTSSATLNGSASSDQSGTIVSYSWKQIGGPSVAAFTGVGAITTVSGLVAGQYVFQLTVTNNAGASATAEVWVTVNSAAPATPIADAGSNQAITLPVNSATLSGAGSSDQGGTIVSYSWRQLAGPSLATFSGSGVTTTVNDLVQGEYIFELTVMNNGGVSAAAEVMVTVNAEPHVAPVANAGPNQTVTLPVASVVLDGSKSYSSDGTIAGYSWEEISGLGGITISNSSTAAPALYNLKAGVYVFELTVTDNFGLTATADVTITVNPAASSGQGSTPDTSILKANAGADTTIALGPDSVVAAVLNGSLSTDSNATITSYQWVEESGPSTVVIGQESSVISTASGLSAGVYVFRLTVADNMGATDTASVTVTVVNNHRDKARPTVSVYPNPTQGIVNINLHNAGGGQMVVNIYDLQGRRIKTVEMGTISPVVEGQIQQVDFSGLARGAYEMEMVIGTSTRLTVMVIRQ